MVSNIMYTQIHLYPGTSFAKNDPFLQNLASIIARAQMYPIKTISITESVLESKEN